MPVYEYYCGDCHTTFEALRTMAAANAPMDCSSCGASRRVNRTITTFARIGGSDRASGTDAGPPLPTSPGGGAGCCGGGCGCRS